MSNLKQNNVHQCVILDLNYQFLVSNIICEDTRLNLIKPCWWVVWQGMLFLWVISYATHLGTTCIQIHSPKMSTMSSFQELDILVAHADYRPAVLRILAAIRPQWKAEDICITVSNYFYCFLTLAHSHNRPKYLRFWVRKQTNSGISSSWTKVTKCVL